MTLYVEFSLSARSSNHHLQGVPLDDGRPRKLGLLGGTFEDGSFSIYVVPDPRDLDNATEESGITYGKSLPTF